MLALSDNLDAKFSEMGEIIFSENNQRTTENRQIHIKKIAVFRKID